MAEKFYTLDQAVEKLAKSKEEITNLVKEGKLREFRDGNKPFYKIEDVDAIATSGKSGPVNLHDSLEISIDESGEVSLAPEELDVLMGTGDKKLETNFQLDETGELLGDEKLDETPLAGTKSSGSDVLLSPAETAGPASATGSGISLDGSQGPDTSSGDTKIAAGGDTINVLSDSDTGYKISDDASGDTKVFDKQPKPLDQKGSLDDGSIARLDEDINLEGAGSGSGLLDLSLQADDTSLGAVLDDIYPENAGAQAPSIDQTPPLPSMMEEAPAVEDDKMFQAPPQDVVDVPDDISAVQQPIPVGAAIAYEAPADTTSNVFGALLFIPFVVLVYSVIVVIAGYKPINLPVVSAVGPIIWYVAAGLAGATILGVLTASVAGAPKKPKAPRAPKAAKAPKPAKEKKAKK